MITVETIELNGIQYKRTYSDTYTITRDGVEYTEAIDPYDSDRVYEETENQSELLRQEKFSIHLKTVKKRLTETIGISMIACEEDKKLTEVIISNMSK